jgi:DNA polymerase III subunit chi
VTRVDFHFNAPDKLEYGCRLVRKAYRAGQRVVVCCDEASHLAAFDEALWTFSQLDFIPHVRAGDALADQTPVVLAGPGPTDAPLPHHEVLVNLGQRTPEYFASFERLIEVVSRDTADRDRARERFRFYKDRGYPMGSHDLAQERARGPGA